MNSRTHRFILTKVLGWHITPGEDSAPKDKKAVFLFAPHTSIWDFVIGYLYCRSIGTRMKIMIKKEAFKGPLGWLLRRLGAFPIDRKNPSKTIIPLIHAIESSDSFYLVICPEGTRKPVHKWKTGYHFIAEHTGLPVYLGHEDFKKKEVGCGQRFELIGDARTDTARIQAAYKSMNLTALHQDSFVTE